MGFIKTFIKNDSMFSVVWDDDVTVSWTFTVKITALIGAEIVHIFRKIKQENVSNGFYLKDSRNLCMCFLKS